MRSIILTLAVFASILGTLFTHSQTAAGDFDPLGQINDLPKVIRVQAEFIEMPLATYTALMAKPRSSANDTDLRAHCAKLLETGKATMIESLAVNALPGQYASSEGVSEFIYPAEVDVDGLPFLEPQPPKPFVPGSPLTPQAFDTKNVGSTFEVEAQIDHTDQIVELRFTPTIVYHVGKRVYGTWTNGEVSIEDSMPRFYVLSARTGATVVPGQPHMVSALSPKNEQGWMDSSRKIMLFVRAEIITVGK